MIHRRKLPQRTSSRFASRSTPLASSSLLLLSVSRDAQILEFLESPINHTRERSLASGAFTRHVISRVGSRDPVSIRNDRFEARARARVTPVASRAHSLVRASCDRAIKTTCHGGSAPRRRFHYRDTHHFGITVARITSVLEVPNPERRVKGEQHINTTPLPGTVCHVRHFSGQSSHPRLASRQIVRSVDRRTVNVLRKTERITSPRSERRRYDRRHNPTRYTPRLVLPGARRTTD